MFIREETASVVLEEVTLQAMSEAAEALVEIGKEYAVWLFFGEMGAGKTTLIRHICKHLGVKDEVSSPTFGLVKEYRIHSDESLFHFDFYRIKSEEEASDMGVDEYFFSDQYCLVEWPEKVPSFWPEEHLRIELIIQNEHTRLIRVTRYDG
ncbi:MAG: tRNA (adenosine(37)-N6)-threonylcarbamoyltransferase complex ATPase subunit type 1 TsaE [Cytophagaceae bacterium]|jgi:tRNA threonylcarbamoyladenosine biosynthesis protein TsaE|nr:tRNA (adenosine(37)-N6)-threonylcarbamoyltransferase complex ATPase subunit type 1 TsaE [Cytophagaceae bacterium]